MTNRKLSDILIDNAKIEKKINVVNLIIANILIIGGIVLFVIANGSSLMITCGIAALIIGLIIIIKMSTKLSLKGTNSSIKETNRYIKSSDIYGIESFLSKEGVNLKDGVKHDGSGDYRLDVVSSCDGKFTCGMFFQYTQYEYQASSEPFEMSKENAKKLIEKIG